MMQLRTSFSTTARPRFASIPQGVVIPAPPPPAARIEGDGLCQLLMDWDAKFFPASGRALVEQKHDGLRAVWIKGGLHTREEAPMPCASHCVPGLQLLEAHFGEPMVFDAEYIEPGGFQATNASHRRGDALPRDPANPPGVLMVFDAVPLRAWEGRAEAPLLEARKRRLMEALARCPSPWLRYVAHAVVMTPAEAERIARYAITQGHEGVVIKDPESPYVRGRSRAWQRIKRVMTVDCPIVAVEPVEHKDGTMATLICDHDGRTVRVTAGFSPAERRELWTFWPRLIGRVVELEAMELTNSGALRHPRFHRWKDKA